MNDASKPSTDHEKGKRGVSRRLWIEKGFTNALICGVMS